MSSYCKCGALCEEDDDRLCAQCQFGYRPGWWPAGARPACHGPYTLLQMIEALHEQTNGTAEAIAPEIISEYEMCIAYAIKHWKHPSSMWERALLTLAVRTLAERKADPETPPDIVCTRSKP